MGNKKNGCRSRGYNMISKITQKERVLLLMGGSSPEREVSMDSGNECFSALKTIGYDVIKLDPGPSIINDILEINPDIVFNSLHGIWGEDGHIQSILEHLRIKYTHSGVISSAKAMNKIISKQIFMDNDIPVAKSYDLNNLNNINIDFPIIIKPINGGSSIGIQFIKSEKQLLNYVNDYKSSLNNFFAEDFIHGSDYTCGVIGRNTTEIAEIKTNNIIFDYKSKYQSNLTEHIIPANLKPNIYEKMKYYALKAHDSLNCRSVSRVDFRYSTESEDELICLEVNTQPGMTKKSLLPELASNMGIPFTELVSWIIRDASIDR
ncbi:MAG: D-alanine--D-alanine ligase [Rhodobiaceae bacterium]|nr:D-alanine--D-alanine ligase [Rhodobiaceae bacterium]